jgi:hypothetical protein
VSIIKSTLLGRLAVLGAQDICVHGPNRPLEPNPPLVHSRVLPEFARGFERVDTGGLPPCALVAGAMDCAVMGAAQGYSEFVARLAAERSRLHVAKTMSVRWLTCTEERLLRQHCQHRLRPCSRVDGCRLVRTYWTARPVGSTERDRYRGRC